MAWTHLPQVISWMPKLRTLHIELDHTEQPTWSIINERAVLASFTTHPSSHNIEFLITLPKLHPKWETPERHFTEDSLHGTLSIRRVHRLRHFIVEIEGGGVELAYKPDFPTLYNMVGRIEECLTMEKFEECEREFWNDGGHL